jgi:hypothetical protein
MSLDVRDFGAVGDGSTDDTAAIQAALDASVGGEVRVPASDGEYIISSPLSITKRVRLVGDGGVTSSESYRPGNTFRGSVIRQTSADTTAIIASGLDAYLTQIDALHIEGPRTNGPGNAGVWCIDSPRGDVNVSDLSVNGFFYGLYFGEGSFYGKVHHSRFFDQTGAGVFCREGGNNHDFYSCLFSSSPYGIDLGGNLSCSIWGGSFEVHTAAAIRANGLPGPHGNPEHGDGLTISGVYFEQNTGAPDILIGDLAPVNGVLISGNYFGKSARTGPGWSIDARAGDSLTAIGNASDSTTGITSSMTNSTSIGNHMRNGGAIVGFTAGGSQGPTGPQGPPGPEGPQGPPGSGGGHSEHVIDDSGSAPPVTVLIEDETEYVYTG